MSRILDYVLEPNVVYTNGAFLIKVKVQDDYKYKKYLVSESMKYTTATGTTFTLTNAVSTNNASILQLQGNTTQNGTPTPSSPIEVQTVSGDNEVVVQNKNLFNMTFYNYGGLITNPLYNSTRLFTVHGIRVKANTEYTVSTNLDTTQFKYGIWLATEDYPLYNSSQRYFDSGWNWTSKRTVTATQGGYLGIIISTSNGNDSLTPSDIEGVTWQIEEGSTETTYIAHSENTYNINFGYTNPIPDTYQEVEYIEATGTQYIDTGFKPCMNRTRIVCDMIPTNDGDNAFFGSRGTFYMFYKVSGNYFWPISQATTVSGTMTVGNKYHLDWNKGRFIATGNDGVYQVKTTSNNTQDTYNMYLFTFNPVDNRNAHTKLFNFKIYYDDVLVREFVPCYRKSDSVIGLYDTVGGTFYTNIGTGTFGKGADKNTQSIELCKIGNYVDSIKKSSGKNIAEFDTTKDTTKYTYTNFKASDITVNKTATGGSFYASFTIHIPKAGTYIFSGITPNAQQMYIYTDYIWGNKKENFTPNRDSNGYFSRPTSFDTAGNYVMAFYGSATGTYSVKNFMCTEIEQTTYEPYGVGTWYIEKNIGKVEIKQDGYIGVQEIISGANKFIWRYASALNVAGSGNRDTLLCNYFVGDTSIWGNNNKIGAYINGSNQTNFSMLCSTVGGTTSNTKAELLSMLETWLNNNKLIMYYPLATPTYTEITDTYLIEQLNNIQDMQLIENLCYVDWVGSIAPTMLLQYPTNETLNAYLITEDNKLIRTDWRFIGRRK